MALSVIARPLPKTVVIVPRSLYARALREIVACGCFHPSGEGDEQLRGFARRVRGEVDILIARLNEFLARIGGAGEAKAKITVTPRVEESVSRIVEETAKLADSVEAIVSRLVELTTPGTEAWRVLSILQLYSFLDVDLAELASNRYVRARFYRVHVKQAPVFEAELSKTEGVVVLEAAREEKDHVLYMVVYPAVAEDAVTETASRLRVQELQVPEGLPPSPAAAVKTIREELERLPKEAAKYRESLLRSVRALEALSQLLRLVESTKLTGSMVVIEGYVSPDAAPRLRNRLERALNGAYVIASEKPLAPHGHEEGEELVPTELRYPAPLRAFAELIEIYGHPRPMEIVPLALTAITLPIIFGMMFPDMGHGLVLALIGLYLYLRSTNGMKAVGQLALYMGLAGMVFGFLAGEFFGADPRIAGWLTEFWHGKPPYSSPVHPIAEAYLAGHELEAEYVNTLVLKSMYISLTLGSVLLTLASGLGIVGALLRREKEELVVAVGRTLTFMGVMTAFLGAAAIAGFEGYKALGPILVAMTGIPMEVELTSQMVLYATIAKLLVFAGLALTFIAPIALGHEPFSMRLISGGMELFDTLLLAVGNTASFIRIMGLMLSHSSLVFGFLVIATQLPGPLWILVYALGNLLVIGLETLVATAHTLRLHFYEMYSKFYQGGGLQYTPAILPRGVIVEVVEK